MAVDRPLAYSYIRFSTAEQAKGSSLARQTERSRKYAEQHGLLLDEALTFKDLGVSAYRASNAGPGGKLGEFLELVKSGRVPRGSYLLIESLDRLSRATISVAAQLLLGLLNEGVKVVTLVDDHVYQQTGTQDDFASLIISLTYLQRANDESRTKGMRVADAWRRKRQGAAKAKLTKLCPAWLKLRDDRSEYIEVPERVAIVREIVDLTRQGLGRGAIAKRLNERGTPSIAPIGKRSKKSADGSEPADHSWHASYVHKILSSRALVGEFQPHRLDEGKRVPDGPPVLGYFPRLIDDDEYDLVQSLVAARGQTSGGRRGATFSNVFTGLLRCGYCGARMVYIDKGTDTRGKRDNRRNRFVLCGKARRGAGCHRVPWVYHEFEEAFFDLATKTDFADFIASSNDRTQQVRSLTDQIAVAEQQLARSKESQRRLVDALATADIQPKGVIERIVKLEEEAASLVERIERLRRDRSAQELRGSHRTEAIAALQEVKQSLGQKAGDEAFLYRASLNQHLRRVIEEITMYPGGLISTEDQARQATARMLASGHQPSAVAEVVAAMFRTKPSSAHRAFVVRNRGVGYDSQFLSPDQTVPDVEQLMLQVAAKRAKSSADPRPEATLGVPPDDK